MDKYKMLIHKVKTKYINHNQPRPFIVALDGLSGAGKTTLVQQLKLDLDNVIIIHIDDHIVTREQRYNTGFDQWYEYYQLQWDTNLLQTILFEALLEGKAELLLPFYNKEHDAIENIVVSIPSNSIVIIEGIFLLREEWKSYYDFIILLNCPQEVRYERVLHRDAYIGSMEDRLYKYRNRYWIAEAYYLEQQAPLSVAHYII